MEIVAAVLLSLAAVAIAWSSYQATRWNGEQAKAASRTNAIGSTRRARRVSRKHRRRSTWRRSSSGSTPGPAGTPLASFYRVRFRKEFKPAFAAWIATRPFANANAPPTPFAMPAYRLASAVEAERLDAEAEESAAAVRRDIQRGSNYVLCVVLFSVSLFFAGMSAKLDVPGLRKVMLVVGCIVFIGTLAWIATFPVSLAV